MAGLVIVAAAGVLVATRADEPRSSGAPAFAAASGWSKLSLPPEIRDGSAFLATDTELLAFGGCIAEVETDEGCRPSSGGYAYDPAEDRWSAMPEAPTAVQGSAAWTGEEAVFLDTAGEGTLRGVAFDPDAKAWRKLPDAPIKAKHSEAVWTGSEVIVWGGGGASGPAAEVGAAYAPASDSWRKIARAPISLNSVSLVWTGSELIAFGSRLDRRNSGATNRAIAAAYDPATDTWRSLADSNLLTGAQSANWIDGELVAYDYGGKYQRLDVSRDRWTKAASMPVEPGECYPDSVGVGGTMLAFYCGQIALLASDASGWSEVSGGLTERVNRSNSYGRPLKVWRFADLAAVDDTVYFLAEGITFGKKGMAEYGFPDAPQSFWAYGL